MAEKKYKVFTPNKEFNGRRYGVVFEKGVALATEKDAIILVKNWGYSCPELFPEKKGGKKKTETKPPEPKKFKLKGAKPGAIVNELARLGHTEFEGKKIMPMWGAEKLAEVYKALKDKKPETPQE